LIDWYVWHEIKSVVVISFKNSYYSTESVIYLPVYYASTRQFSSVQLQNLYFTQSYNKKL